MSIKEYYIVVDAEDREVNFFDRTFPNSRSLAILSARQVEGSVVLHRKVDSVTGNKQDSIIWPE
jgi:hypothetical protein